MKGYKDKKTTFRIPVPYIQEKNNVFRAQIIVKRQSEKRGKSKQKQSNHK